MLILGRFISSACAAAVTVTQGAQFTVQISRHTRCRDLVACQSPRGFFSGFSFRFFCNATLEFSEIEFYTYRKIKTPLHECKILPFEINIIDQSGTKQKNVSTHMNIYIRVRGGVFSAY